MLALVEDVAERSGDESSIIVAADSSSHGEGLAATRLSICEDGAIEAFECGINHILGYFIKDLFLFSIHVEYLIELK